MYGYSLECDEEDSFYSLKMVGLLRYFRTHCMQPPPGALIVPHEQGGVERSWGQCGHTLGQPSHHRLALVGCWLGLDGSHAGVLAKF